MHGKVSLGSNVNPSDALSPNILIIKINSTCKSLKTKTEYIIKMHILVTAKELDECMIGSLYDIADLFDVVILNALIKPCDRSI